MKFCRRIGGVRSGMPNVPARLFCVAVRPLPGAWRFSDNAMITATDNANGAVCCSTKALLGASKNTMFAANGTNAMLVPQKKSRVCPPFSFLLHKAIPPKPVIPITAVINITRSRIGGNAFQR